MPQDLTYRSMALIGRAKYITALDFAGTNLGPNARNLADGMTYWQPEHPLQELYLTRCNIFPQFCGAMLVHINKCHLLTHLDLSGNTIGSHGNHLADAIKSWVPKPHMKTLNLSNCFIPLDVCANILSVLGRCEVLTYLWLSGNSLTGSVCNFLPDPHPGLPALEEIFISKTGVVSYTNPPVISGPQPENNGPPPLTLGKEVKLCWLLPLTLEPSADMHLSPSIFSPDRNIFK